MPTGRTCGLPHIASRFPVKSERILIDVCSDNAIEDAIRLLDGRVVDLKIAQNVAT